MNNAGRAMPENARTGRPRSAESVLISPVAAFMRSTGLWADEKTGASVYLLIRALRGPVLSPASSLRVMRTASARLSAERGSLRIPAGKSFPFPKGSVASTSTMSRSLRSRTCWKPSSRIRVSGLKACPATRPARYRSLPTTTGTPGSFAAMRAGSSPPSLLSAKTACPSDTTTMADGSFLPYPLLTTTGCFPFLSSKEAI